MFHRGRLPPGSLKILSWKALDVGTYAGQDGNQTDPEAKRTTEELRGAFVTQVK